MEEIKEYIQRYKGIQPPHIALYTQAVRFHLESAIKSAQLHAQCLEATNTIE